MKRAFFVFLRFPFFLDDEEGWRPKLTFNLVDSARGHYGMLLEKCQLGSADFRRYLERFVEASGNTGHLNLNASDRAKLTAELLATGAWGESVRTFSLPLLLHQF
jgi:hypothetical protein